MKSCALWVGLVVGLCAVAPAAASEESRRLNARGLWLLQSGFEADALDAFEKALAADPGEIEARYYRGMLRGNRGELAASLEDLRAVLRARPDLHQAALELGVGLVQSGAYRESLPWLKQAQQVAAFEAKASLYLGLAYLRLDELDTAAAAFQQVRSDDAKIAQAARYYVGVVAYQQEHWSAAETAFREVAAQHLGSAYESEAAGFLLSLQKREHVPYRLRGSIGFEYDSNVILAPDDQVLKQRAGVSNQEDGRFSVAAGGTYAWRLEPVRIAASYDFYQSLHFDLHEFNLQDHRPAIELSTRRGPVEMGVLGEYNFYLKETSSFLQEGIAMPWLAVNAGDFGRTELSYRMRRRDFLDDQFEIRDAFNHAGAVRQIVYLGPGQRYVSLGYRFDVDDPVDGGDAQAFAYFANEVNTGIGWELPFEVLGQASYAFRHETYRAKSSIYTDSPDARRDNEHDIVVALSRSLCESVSVSTGYSGTINNSNAAAFEYDRHIASVALQMRW